MLARFWAWLTRVEVTWDSTSYAQRARAAMRFQHPPYRGSMTFPEVFRDLKEQKVKWESWRRDDGLDALLFSLHFPVVVGMESGKILRPYSVVA